MGRGDSLGVELLADFLKYLMKFGVPVHVIKT